VGAGLWGPAACFGAGGAGGGQAWTTFTPCADRDRVARRYGRWQAAVERALGLDVLDESEEEAGGE